MNTPLKLDISIDRTFHWKHDILKLCGVIPYTSDWIGFLHHTFDETFSKNNNVELFKNETFMTSLASCKGIFVMSYYLQAQVKNALAKVGFPWVPVYVVYHPTEFNCITFNVDKFLVEPRALVHVGSWLRHFQSFYDIPYLYKYLLRGRGQSTTVSCDCISSYDPDLPPVSPPKGIISVDFLQAQDYDTFLSEKVVFLNLIDASACNTLIECMVRSVPIIINKHPAVVEYIGESYPLFYPNGASQEVINQYVLEVMASEQLIRSAHSYLQTLQINKLSIAEFEAEVEKIIFP
jgi:hypothetical protein